MTTPENSCQFLVLQGNPPTTLWAMTASFISPQQETTGNVHKGTNPWNNHKRRSNRGQDLKAQPGLSALRTSVHGSLRSREFAHRRNRKPFQNRGKLNAWLRRISPDAYKQRDKPLPANKPFVPVLEWSPSQWYAALRGRKMRWVYNPPHPSLNSQFLRAETSKLHVV
jgi:hypothetical protein